MRTFLEPHLNQPKSVNSSLKLVTLYFEDLVTQAITIFMQNISQMMMILLLLMQTLFSESLKRVVVCGGGAAGYFSAIECARTIRSVGAGEKCEVVILEAGTPLSKVLISGGGRCNVMHDPMKTPSEISKGYPRGSRELIGPLSSLFTPWDTFEWFQSRLPTGMTLKTEPDGRVFPSSDRAGTIIDILQGEAKRLGVKVFTGARVSSVTSLAPGLSANPEGTFVVTYKTADPLPASLPATSVIMATGSARPAYAIAQSLGHSITAPLPSLFSFKVADSNLTQLAGVASPTARVKLLTTKAQRAHPDTKAFLRPPMLPLYSHYGPLLVTHMGLSGPAVLKLSAYGARLMAALGYVFDIEVKWIGGGGSGVGTGGSASGMEGDALVELEDEELQLHLENAKNRWPQRAVGKGFPPLDMSGGKRVHDSGFDDDSEGDVDGDPATDNFLKMTRRLWLYLLSRASPSIDPTTPWSRITTKEIASIVKECLHSTYACAGRALYKDEFTTAGGVRLSEISMKTMESKICPGLFLCGELVDIDGITGGYNFQSAWSTGFIAGAAAGSLCVGAQRPEEA